MTRRILIALALILFALDVFVQVNGGFNVRVAGVPLRAWEPLRALGASLLLFFLVALVYRRDFTLLLDRVGARTRAGAPFLAGTLAIALAVHGIVFGGRAVGVLAAIVLVTSPVVLYQAVRPMSDVPAGASWTGAMVFAFGSMRSRAAAAGIFTAVGLLVRPNLVLAAVVPFVVTSSATRGRERVLRAAIFCAPILPVIIAVAAFNTASYGGRG